MHVGVLNAGCLPMLLSSPPQLSEAEIPGSMLERALGFVRRQHIIVLGVCLAALAGAGFYLMVTKSVYTASATMIIDLSKGQFFQKSVLGDTPTDSAWIDSQIGTLALERDKIGLTVAKQLDLASDPDFTEVKSSFWDDLASAFGSAGGSAVGSDQPTRDQLLQRAASQVANRLEVKRVGFSYLVTINYSSENPDKALKVANAAADAYVNAEMDAKFRAIGKASEWLQQRYQALRDQATAADRAVVEFKAKHNIVTTSGKLINEQQLSEINTRLVAARARTADAQAKLSRIETVLEMHQATGNVDPTVSDSLNNPIITKLQAQYLELMNRQADWSVRFGANHLAVVNLRNQAKEIRNSIREELKRIAESYRSDYEIAKKNQEEIEKQLAEAVAQVPNDAQITLRGLESSAQSYRTYYDNFFQHYTESVQQQTSPISDTRIIAYANNAYKSYPSTLRILALSLFGGLGLGVGLGLLREASDRAFRTSSQVHTSLQADCLALIPLVARRRVVRNARLPKPARKAIASLRGQRMMESGLGTFRVVSEAPFSRFAEAIRAIKLAIDLRRLDGAGKVIGLTSAVPREGKTTIAAALASHAAQVGGRVILVDCDLRNPAMSRLLAPDVPAGIVEVIKGEASFDKVVWTDPVTKMAFLPAASKARVTDTDEILASDAMRCLIDVLRSNYDYVIVDLSPLAPVVDVRATSRFIDCYLLVVEWGTTKIDVVQKALQDAPAVHDNLLGTVLNKVNIDIASRYEGERAEYYRNKYSAAYGYTD
jgi:succinoglycan biosynthesis transport protein ExoP